MMKININKVHSELISNFEEVKICEKSNKEFGNYFEISTIKENKEVRMIITKKDIENSKFNWSYYSDPLNESSFLIERVSTTESVVNDVRDILDKNRFDEEYLLKIAN